jgi:hypothetical protein
MKVQTTVSIELELTVEATFVPGYPARGPSYASGGEPAEPDTFEDYILKDISVNGNSLMVNYREEKALLISDLFNNLLFETRSGEAIDEKLFSEIEE